MRNAKSVFDSRISLREATWGEYRASQSLSSLLDRYRLDRSDMGAKETAKQHAKRVAHWVQNATGSREERWHQCHILRDIFRRPGQPSPNLGFACVKADVTDLAQRIYDRADFSRVPELADRLEAGGCANIEILTHCRDHERHVRGCWALDLVLGKE